MKQIYVLAIDESRPKRTNRKIIKNIRKQLGKKKKLVVMPGASNYLERLR